MVVASGDEPTRSPLHSVRPVVFRCVHHRVAAPTSILRLRWAEMAARVTMLAPLPSPITATLRPRATILSAFSHKASVAAVVKVAMDRWAWVEALHRCLWIRAPFLFRSAMRRHLVRRSRSAVRAQTRARGRPSTSRVQARSQPAASTLMRSWRKASAEAVAVAAMLRPASSVCWVSVVQAAPAAAAGLSLSPSRQVATSSPVGAIRAASMHRALVVVAAAVAEICSALSRSAAMAAGAAMAAR